MNHYIREDPLVFKVLLAGPSGKFILTLRVGVGKTSLILKYIKNIFSYQYQVTLGVQFFTKTIQVNQKQIVKLQIWDTVGQQAFRSIVRSFYKGVSAVLLIYSIDDRQSFIELSSWLHQIREYAHPQVMIYLIGTKLDLQSSQMSMRNVTFEEGKKYKNSIHADLFMQVSAKTGENLKQLFEKLAKTLVKKYHQSSSFKCLVTPLSTQDTPSRAQSFHLKYDAIAKKSVIKKNSGCC